MKKIILPFLCIISTGLFAQVGYDFNNYNPLKCSGLIPEDFLLLTQEKYKADVTTEKQSAKNHIVTKQKDEFLLQSI